MDYNIYSIFLIETFVLLLIAATFNTLTYNDLIFNLIQWINIGLIILLLIAKPQARMKFKNYQMLFNEFFILPLIFFKTGGYNGTAFLFAAVGVFALASSYAGKKRIAVIAVHTILYVGCIVIAYAYPELVTPVEDELSRVMDLALSTAMIIIGSAFIAGSVSSSYKAKNLELSNTVIKDPLTGAYNRRYLFNDLAPIISTHSGEYKKCCFLMLDIDFFKKINDTYGHQAGDEALVAFTRATRDGLRDSDILVRYGGEEFVAILKNTEYDEAIDIAQRVKSEVGSINYKQGFKTTASIGVGVLRKDDSIEEILARIDSYLYEAKEKGRNMVVSNDNTRR